MSGFVCPNSMAFFRWAEFNAGHMQATVDLGHWIRSELDTQTGSSLSPSPARN